MPRPLSAMPTEVALALCLALAGTACTKKKPADPPPRGNGMAGMPAPTPDAAGLPPGHGMKPPESTDPLGGMTAGRSGPGVLAIGLKAAKHAFAAHLDKQKSVLPHGGKFTVVATRPGIDLMPWFLVEARFPKPLYPGKVYAGVSNGEKVLRGDAGFTELIKSLDLAKRKSLTAKQLVAIDNAIRSQRPPVVWNAVAHKAPANVHDPKLKWNADGSGQLQYFTRTIPSRSFLRRTVAIAADGTVKTKTDRGP